MSQLTRLLSAFPVLVAFTACGGSANHEASGGSSNNTGGAPFGGSSATAGGRIGAGGAYSVGGSTAGGAMSTFGGAGGVTSAGAGGGHDPSVCSLPADAGPCDAAIPSFFHNPASHQCEPFVYGGCQGNANRFNSIAECESACPGATPSIDACDTSLDCLVQSAGCCGACEPVTAGDLIAINRTHVNDRMCTVSCGPCPELPRETTSRYFIAGCAAHRCQVVDIRETQAVACKVDSDCYLRAGAGCCPICTSPPVALSVDANVADLFCGGLPLPCPACAPAIPPGYSTTCEGGKCVVHEPRCTGSAPC
ncbi:MAG TPA: BPTI/Kunitz domain-containing protein [Polyangiaceae bacterium]|nr:BPTI/Kunitz domain-containing protein [Polyangiaceae bacterium]